MKNGKNTGFDTKTIDNLRRELPAVFGRQAVGKLIPGIISEKSLANLAVNDEGPPYKVVRRRVCYERGSFLDWLENQVQG